MSLPILLRRFLQSGLSLWLITSLVFLLSHRGPGAEEMFLADGSVLTSTQQNSAAEQEQLKQSVKKRLGLDLPVFYVSREEQAVGRPRWFWHGAGNQYHHWLRGLLHGDLGISLRTGQPVTDLLLTTLGYTLPLTASALVLVLGAALLLGQELANFRRWWHAVLRTVLVGIHSLPLFVVALGLLLLFANPEMFSWFPVYGMATDDEPLAWEHLGSILAHLALPVMSLVLVTLPDLTLQLEGNLRFELRAGYAVTARAKGLSERRVIHHHALRNALLPMLAQLTELVPALVAGSIVVEVVYSLPGMGRLLAESAAKHDYPVLVGGLLLTGAVRLGSLLVGDIIYSRVDPRIKW